MNTLTEALSKLEKIEKPVEENKIRLSKEQKTLKESLMRKVNQVNTANCRNSFELTKAYEKALQEGINNVYPDIHWSDVTNCDIMSTLLTTNNDVDETVNRILFETTSPKKKSNSKTLNESTKSLKPRKKKLSEGRWDYTLQSGRALRDAIESGDLYYVKNALINSYKELEQAGIIDEYDCEQYCDEVEEIDTDDDGAEELLDYELNDFYDLCDNSNVWVSLTEALDEDVQEDPTPREILQGLKDGMSIGEAAGLDD